MQGKARKPVPKKRVVDCRPKMRRASFTAVLYNIIKMKCFMCT